MRFHGKASRRSSACSARRLLPVAGLVLILAIALTNLALHHRVDQGDLHSGEVATIEHDALPAGKQDPLLAGRQDPLPADTARLLDSSRDRALADPEPGIGLDHDKAGEGVQQHAVQQAAVQQAGTRQEALQHITQQPASQQGPVQQASAQRKQKPASGHRGMGAETALGTEPRVLIAELHQRQQEAREDAGAAAADATAQELQQARQKGSRGEGAGAGARGVDAGELVQQAQEAGGAVGAAATHKRRRRKAVGSEAVEGQVALALQEDLDTKLAAAEHATKGRRRRKAQLGAQLGAQQAAEGPHRRAAKPGAHQQAGAAGLAGQEQEAAAQLGAQQAGMTNAATQQLAGAAGEGTRQRLPGGGVKIYRRGAGRAAQKQAGAAQLNANQLAGGVQLEAQQQAGVAGTANAGVQQGDSSGQLGSKKLGGAAQLGAAQQAGVGDTALPGTQQTGAAQLGTQQHQQAGAEQLAGVAGAAQLGTQQLAGTVKLGVVQQQQQQQAGGARLGSQLGQVGDVQEVLELKHEVQQLLQKVHSLEAANGGGGGQDEGEEEEEGMEDQPDDNGGSQQSKARAVVETVAQTVAQAVAQTADNLALLPLGGVAADKTVSQLMAAAAAAAAAASAAAGGGPAPGSLDQYHVVMSTSLGVYTRWQSRVHYYWYKRVKAQAPHRAMGGFTRLLSATEPDGLEQEIPTVLVDPLPPDLERIANGFVVLNRPYGFQQWARKHLPLLPEKYILMAEPDHIFLQAPPLWATPTTPVGYPFDYMRPGNYPEIVARFNTRNVPPTKIGPIGNSPVMIHRDQFLALVDEWVDLSFKIKQDPEADKAWGWVQEMYAYSIAASQARGGPIWHDLRPEFMLQPPWDASIRAINGEDAVIIHYTYGDDFDEAGQFTPGKVGAWHFDKRDYTDKYPPLNFPMPPAGCTNEAVKELIRRINQAAESFPDWEQHSRS